MACVNVSPHAGGTGVLGCGAGACLGRHGRRAAIVDGGGAVAGGECGPRDAGPRRAARHVLSRRPSISINYAMLHNTNRAAGRAGRAGRAGHALALYE